VLTLPWSEAAALPVTRLKAAITAFVGAVDRAPPDLSARVAQETCAPLRLRLLAELARFGPAYVRRNLGAAVAESERTLQMALLGEALIDVLAFGAYRQPELLLNIMGLRYCG